MPAKKTVSGTAGMTEFCAHLETLIFELDALHGYHNDTSLVHRKSSHMRIKGEALKRKAQNAADVLSTDLNALLHPGLGFENWHLNVKANGRALRWARRGSRGRGGVDVDAGYLPGTLTELCTWVAASQALPELAPVESAEMTRAGLEPSSPHRFKVLYRAFNEAKFFEVSAPTPTMAYLRSCILQDMPRMLRPNSLVEDVKCQKAEDKLSHLYADLQDVLSDFPCMDGRLAWSPLLVIKDRLIAHPIASAAMSPRKLGNTFGQLGEKAATALAILAMRFADEVQRESGPHLADLPQKRWVVTCGTPQSNAPAGLAFMARTRAEALMVASISMLENGPYPAPFETWQVYAVEPEADAPASGLLHAQADIDIPARGWGGE